MTRRSWIIPDTGVGIDPTSEPYRRCFEPHPYDFMDPDAIAEAQWFQHYAAWHAEDGTETSLFDDAPHPEETAHECLMLSGEHVTVAEAPAVFAEFLSCITEANDDDCPY